jgi:putative addiction module component (TIGR02574 family)
MSILLEEARKLPIPLRQELADAINESIVEELGSVKLTSEQIAELERRVEDYEANPGTGRSWEQVRDAALKR